MVKANERVLVVAAHPDDEVLGCGATIKKHTALGDTVTVLLLGQGIAARSNVKEVSGDVKKLKRSAKKANKILGVERLLFCNFPDNAYDSIPLLDIVRAIEKIVDETSPTIIYTHHNGDVNVDHRCVAEAIQAATRPMAAQTIKRVLAFEVPSSSELNFTGNRKFLPSVFINVEKYMENKISALEAYGSEMREFPHPRSFAYVNALATIRGGQIGFNAAEAFQLAYERIW